MNEVRQACVAGYFYPADPKILATTVQQLLDAAPTTAIGPPKAIIAPHAGYVYSGPIAASIYKTLLPHKDNIKRVVLLGPAHRVGFQGIAATNVEGFATPLGVVPVDIESVQKALMVPEVKVLEQAYEMEHSLEVQLPFLQTVLSNFRLSPYIVGLAGPQDVAKLLVQLWGGPETLIVISSDLSHYYDYDTAKKLDADTSQAILELAPNRVDENRACGRLPIQGLLLAAAQLNLTAHVIDQRNSGDTAGDKQRVVGYGAYHFI
jgi:AmmeMemoRadiSam system protein B